VSQLYAIYVSGRLVKLQRAEHLYEDDREVQLRDSDPFPGRIIFQGWKADGWSIAAIDRATVTLEKLTGATKDELRHVEDIRKVSALYTRIYERRNTRRREEQEAYVAAGRLLKEVEDHDDVVPGYTAG